ncbi:unnamed protein product [Clonostachys rhizophaga]|uniref:NB-ARC domain-containing protein n=1 Tax=Clonostachys rhizophaga TaxID=160324 RepID=A0A9N9YM85_9HYPO|nr:unnamed protein product [Clonostachys rhizophaga]
MGGMEQAYKDKKTAKILKNLTPALASIRSFGGINDTAVPPNLDVAALMWGGIKLVLDLLLRSSIAIEKITAGFSEISKALSRFEEYQSFFYLCPTSKRCSENVLSSLWTNQEAMMQSSMQKIRRQGQVIDVEAHAAKMNMDKSRHEEIKKLLNYKRPVPSVSLPYFQLPLSEHLPFFGRVTELNRCAQALSTPSDIGAPKIFALHGLPGVGKTSIALDFSRREKPRYQIIIWLWSDEVTKLARGYVDAAAGLSLHQENASAQEDRETFLTTWRDPSKLADYMPSSGNGSILVTSRDPESQFGMAGEGLKVEPFGIDDAQSFLLNRLPSVHASEETLSAAKVLVTQLGGLPLGIRQMAGFMRETGCSIRDLLVMIEDTEQHGKIRSYETSSFARLTYPSSLASALEVSLSKLDEPALNLLALFSTLDPDGIQDSVTKHLPVVFQRFPTSSPPFISQQSESFVTYHHRDFISIMYLVETGAMTTALTLAQAAEPFCDLKTDDGQVGVSYLYNTYGVIALQYKDDKAAWGWFEKSLDIRTRLLGEYNYTEIIQRLMPFRDRAFTVMADHPVRIKNPIFDQLAMAYLGLGQFDEAWSHLNISMDLSKEDNLPMFSQGSAYDYYVSGNIRMAQCDLTDALRLHTIALNIRQQVLGSHIQTAASCYRVGDFAVLLQSYEMYDELGLAEAFLECGKARSAWRMASILRAHGEIEGASKYASEAEEARFRLSGNLTKEDASEDDFNALLNYMDT